VTSAAGPTRTSSGLPTLQPDECLNCAREKASGRTIYLRRSVFRRGAGRVTRKWVPIARICYDCLRALELPDAEFID
jgi:hypothetical protein